MNALRHLSLTILCVLVNNPVCHTGEVESDSTTEKSEKSVLMSHAEHSLRSRMPTVDAIAAQEMQKTTDQTLKRRIRIYLKYRGDMKKRTAERDAALRGMMRLAKDEKQPNWIRRYAIYTLGFERNDETIGFLLENTGLTIWAGFIPGLGSDAATGDQQAAEGPACTFILSRIQDWRVAQIILKKKVAVKQSQPQLRSYAQILARTFDNRETILSLVRSELQRAKRRSKGLTPHELAKKAIAKRQGRKYVPKPKFRYENLKTIYAIMYREVHRRAPRQSK